MCREADEIFAGRIFYHSNAPFAAIVRMFLCLKKIESTAPAAQVHHDDVRRGGAVLRSLLSEHLPNFENVFNALPSGKFHVLVEFSLPFLPQRSPGLGLFVIFWPKLFKALLDVECTPR